MTAYVHRCDFFVSHNWTVGFAGPTFSPSEHTMTTMTTMTTSTLPEAVAATLEALWTFGPPSVYAGVDPDSERVVAYALAPTVQRLVALVGDDPAKRDEAKALLRAGVLARSTHTYDRGQADRLCRAVQRGWMVAMIRRHPRAARFQSLVDALNRGRYSEKQRGLALELIAEVA